MQSGTRITARLATEYNKDVLAIPGSIFSRGSELPNSLIADGAKLVTCANDILEVFGIFKSDSERSESTRTESNGDEQSTKDLTDTEKSVLALIKEPTLKDKLLSQAENPSDILVTLTMLEWRGFIKEEGGVVRRVK
jgi:DNA processing protein